MLIGIGVLVIVLLTAATGYFVAQEFAYVAVDRNRLRQAADAGDGPAARALGVTRQLSFMLSGAQLGITVTGLLVGYVAEPYVGAGLAEILGGAGVPESVSLSVSVIIALLFSTLIQMVFGELAPKNLAIARPEALARALSRSTVIYLKVAGPVIRLFDAAANKLLRSVGIEPVEELPHGATAEDLEHIIDESHAGGHLDAELFRQLEGGLDFRTLDAGQVMTPRVDVHTIGAGEPVARVVELLSTGRSRFPVIGSNVDDVVGVVSIADVLQVPRAERAATLVGAVASPALFVPESLPAPELLERLRTENRQLACVVDEYGGLAGVVSYEDVAEEVVGEILDEDDKPEARARRRADGSWVVPARWRIDEIAEETGVELPGNGAYETVGGLVLQQLGRTATPGDIVDVPLATVDDPNEGEHPARIAQLAVVAVQRHVPHTIALSVRDLEVES
ncbi:hemolysin family protein [Phytomonospora endophytica]|uniref:CBS domain containing-hemolysin-like protein n=1 Tax=Phytomonospora endophytica TaxID=714109 RepID=A0A841FJM9_9ACTN|nr:hemolysin family protein [Phytomonospora endophytica]MBB6033357.1 CBS domain containing-hemolysin-like protein [Phytomonospora endophytica]GIG70871.1 membrane protein [Phytomonospora endophytica]